MHQSPTQSIRPVIIGIIATILMLAALAYIANSRRQISGSIPDLTIVSPAAGALADSPLVVRFTSTAPVTLLPTGWGAADLHLHARVSGVELMPAAADIQQTGDTFAWTMPTVRKGPVTLRLGWADTQHRELRSGASYSLSIVVR